MSLIFYARGDSSTANNNYINSQNQTQVPVTTLEFVDLDGGTPSLDYNNGLPDDDTMMLVNGVPAIFTVEFSGTLGDNNKYKDINGFDLRGADVVVVTDENTGQRYYFLTGPEGTAATMADFPNGSLPLGTFDDSTDIVLCFAAGSRLQTPQGPKRIEDLQPGDLVTTEEGSQPVRWIGHRKLSGPELFFKPNLRPIRVSAHALGRDIPRRDVVLSPNHSVLLQGWRVELHTGSPMALIPVKHLVNGSTIQQICPPQGVEYYHLLLADHHVVACENLWSETLFPAQMGEATTEELALIELPKSLQFDPEGPSPRSAYPKLKKFEAKLAC